MLTVSLNKPALVAETALFHAASQSRLKQPHSLPSVRRDRKGVLLYR